MFWRILSYLTALLLQFDGRGKWMQNVQDVRGWVRHKELEIVEFPPDPGMVKLKSQHRPEIHDCRKRITGIPNQHDPAQARGKDIAKHGG